MDIIRTLMRPLHDLDQARAIHEALIAIFVANHGGENNPAVLSLVSRLCEAAVAAVNDLDCRVAIRGVQSLATLLFSDDGHAGVEAAGSLRGADAVRFQILNALSNFRGRLDVLESRPPSRPEIPPIASMKNLRVLVVEDNRDSADTLRKLLELCGYAVTVAYNAADGIEAAKRTRPDVVLCDIGLPDQEGYALAAALRKNPNTASARLIAVTAYGQEKDRERSREAGFEGHLVKPVNPETLLGQLEGKKNESAAADKPPLRVVVNDRPK